MDKIPATLKIHHVDSLKMPSAEDWCVFKFSKIFKNTLNFT
jgi:hypothetical protein